MHDITVVLNKKYNIDWKHIFEKKLDEVMIPLGFSRTGSTVKTDNTTEIYFRQFGVCKNPTQKSAGAQRRSEK